MELRHVRLTDPAVAPLLADLATEYHTRYGSQDEMSRAHAEEFDPPAGRFVVLIDDGVTVAGGGFRSVAGMEADPADGRVCEVKRMWTSPDHRRQGHAARVLAALEAAAREAGYAILRLETGPRQPEAISLYTSAGYRRIPTYGRYAEALAFERHLSVGATGDPGATGDAVADAG